MLVDQVVVTAPFIWRLLLELVHVTVPVELRRTDFIWNALARSLARSLLQVRLCGERRDVFTSSRTGSSLIRGVSWQWDITWKRVATLARAIASNRMSCSRRRVAALLRPLTNPVVKIDTRRIYAKVYKVYKFKMKKYVIIFMQEIHRPLRNLIIIF